MVTLNQYIKEILQQILDSHDILEGLKDSTRDLTVLKREWLKVQGILYALIRKLESIENKSNLQLNILKRSKYYIENYDFEREIQILMPLYSEDMHRIKNMQYKILESFDDKKFLNDIKDTINEIT